MILRRVASLSHTLVDNIAEQVAEDGTRLLAYARWLKQRIRQLGGSDYRPTIHLDLHGALGQIFENNLGRVLGHLYGLDLATKPYPLRVESPIIMESREAQIEAMKTLRDYVGFRNMNTQLVVDKWANTFDDIKAFGFLPSSNSGKLLEEIGWQPPQSCCPYFVPVSCHTACHPVRITFSP